MSPDAVRGLPDGRVAVAAETASDHDLMVRALAIYLPDLGLAIHGTLEAREVVREMLGTPILDLGCGDGRFARLWAGGLPQVPKILRCDLWPPAVRRAVTEDGLTLAVAADGRQLRMAIEKLSRGSPE